MRDSQDVALYYEKFYLEFFRFFLEFSNAKLKKMWRTISK